MFKYTFVYLYLWIYFCIFIFDNILMYIYMFSWLRPQPSTPPRIPIITCRTTWCWNLTLLKLMSNFQKSSLQLSKCWYSRSPHLKHHTQYNPKWNNQCHNMLQYQNSLLMLLLLLNSTLLLSDINFTKVAMNQIIKSTLSHYLIKLQLKRKPSMYIVHIWYDIYTHVVYAY